MRTVLFVCNHNGNSGGAFAFGARGVISFLGIVAAMFYGLVLMMGK